MQRLSTFDPHSTLARPITHLFVIVGIVMLAILLLVMVLAVYASIRYRSKKGQPEPQQRFGTRQLEIAWTAGPIFTLAFIFAATIPAMTHSNPSPGSEQQRT